MRYWVRSLLGVAVIAGAIALAAVSLYHLMRTGSCSDGGPSLGVRPCPEGTGRRVLTLLGSIFVVPVAGLWLLAGRARSPAGPMGGTAGAGAIGTLWFFLLFTCMGAAALVAGLGPAAIDGGPGDQTRSASLWVGGTFLLIGAPVLLVLAAGATHGAVLRRRARTASRSPFG